MNTKKLLSIALALAMILAIAPLANVANAAGGMGETVLEQNFDDTTKFDAAVGGEIDDTANIGGKWQSFATDANPGSTIATGSVNIVDADKVVIDNRVLAVKYMNLNNNCPVLVDFHGSNMGQDTDFIVKFRICRIADAAMFVGIGNGQFTADKQHAAISIADNGAVTVGDSTTAIGTLAKNVWATVELRSNKSGSATGSYTVTVTPDNASSFSGNANAKDSNATTGYNSTNVNKMIIRATSGSASGTAIAYMDDIYVERVKANPVQVDQDFEDVTLFVTDTVSTEVQTAIEKWTFKTTGTPADGSCVVNIAYGDETVYFAASGKQALKGFRSSSGKGAITIYPKETLGAGEDFALSFNYLRPTNAGPFTFTVGNSGSDTAVASLKIEADGSLYLSSGASWNDSGYNLHTNTWMNITLATDMANDKFSVVVNVDGTDIIDVDSGVPNDANELTFIYINGMLVSGTPGFVYGYFDDFSLEHVTSGGTEAYLAQDFENTAKFIVGNKVEVATGDVGGRWTIKSDDTINTMVINTKDGDGLVTDWVASGTQSLKLVRVGSQNKGHINAELGTTINGYDDYELSLKVYHKAGNAFSILLGKGGGVATANDATIKIAADGAISLFDAATGDLAATGKYLMPGEWATLTLVTERDAGTYTVAVQYEDDATATEIGTGDLNWSDVTKLRFHLDTYVTADTTVAYVDDIAINNYDNTQPTYNVTVNGTGEEDVDTADIGAGKAAWGSHLTIHVDYDSAYEYTVSATVGGNAVTINKLQETCTIAGADVKGDVVITINKTLIDDGGDNGGSGTGGDNTGAGTGGDNTGSGTGGDNTGSGTGGDNTGSGSGTGNDNTGSGSGTGGATTHTHSLTKVNGVAATEDAEGVKEHYTCTCGKKFADAAGTTEITDVSIPKLPASTPEDDVVPPTGDMGIAHLLGLAMSSVGAIVELKKKFRK